MIAFVLALMGGAHEDLPHRRARPLIDFDPTTGAFVADDGPRPESTWLGRGELPPPGRRIAPAVEAEGHTVADEMRALASLPPAPR